MTHRPVILLILMFAGLVAEGCRSMMDEPKVVFASVSEGRKILLSKDPYLSEMQQSDVDQRFCSDSTTTLEVYHRMLGESVRAWAEEEKLLLERLMDSVRVSDPGLMKLLSNEPIIFIKTSGAEEAGAFYTRQSAIIFPEPSSYSSGELLVVLRHELFHILSRRHRVARSKLYLLLGYKLLDSAIKLPSNIRQLLVHNPDSPEIDYYREAELGASTVIVLQQGRCLFDRMELVTYPLRSANGLYSIDTTPKVATPSELSNVPEEVLAEAFGNHRLNPTALSTSIDSIISELAR